jgi:membrane-associated phospholipid phosphatase
MIRKLSIANDDTPGNPIPLPNVKKVARLAVPLGIVFWVIALILWRQQRLDETALFYFDSARVAYTPFVAVMKWLSVYGMSVIAVLLAFYLVTSHFVEGLNAPLTIYLYTITSMALSGIAGDLLKEIIRRPRPVAIFADQVFVLSNAMTKAIPSGHATKSVALILPFLFLVHSSSRWDKIMKLTLPLIAGGVCLSRVVLGAHYVSDVLAGIGMALIGLPLTMLFAHMILKQSTQEQLPMMSKIWGVLLIAMSIIFMLI